MNATDQLDRRGQYDREQRAYVDQQQHVTDRPRHGQSGKQRDRENDVTSQRTGVAPIHRANCSARAETERVSGASRELGLLSGPTAASPGAGNGPSRETSA